MKDYTKYTIIDFVLDDSFRRWALKNTNQDGLMWESWSQLHPDKSEMIAFAKQIVFKMHQAQESLTEEEIKNEVARLSEARMAQPVFVRPLLNRITWWKQAVAALVIFGVFGGIYYTYQAKFNPPLAYEIRKSQLGSQLVEIFNESTTDKKVKLPDGSEVSLRPYSRLSYPKKFALANRTVYLSGEGFFHVTKNPQSPFLVYANEIVTKVLGTSFIVRAFEKDAKVEVIVKTGKVSVYSVNEAATHTLVQQQLNGFVLTPNQQVVFDRKQLNMEKSLVSLPELVEAPEEEKPHFTFNNTPVNEALDALSNGYGVAILYDKKVLKSCQISAEFTNESFYAQLDLICKAIDAQYEIVDAQVVIDSKGCAPH